MNATITVYTLSYQITGQVSYVGRRLSDHLNDPRTDCVTLDQAVGRSLLAQGPVSPMGSVAIKKASVEFIAALVDLLDPLRPRIQTQSVRMAMGLDFFTVEGLVHRQTSDPTDVAVFLSRPGRAFIPVTDTRFSYLPNADFDGGASVLFLNASRIRFCGLHWSSQMADSPHLLVPA